MGRFRSNLVCEHILTVCWLIYFQNYNSKFRDTKQNPPERIILSIPGENMPMYQSIYRYIDKKCKENILFLTISVFHLKAFIIATREKNGFFFFFIWFFWRKCIFRYSFLIFNWSNNNFNYTIFKIKIYTQTK